MALALTEKSVFLNAPGRWREFISFVTKSSVCFFSSQRTNYQLLPKGLSKEVANNLSVIENRKRLCKRLNIDYRDMVSLKQVHGADVYIATQKDKGRGSVSFETAIDGFDAVSTNEKNVPICILTADCLGIFFYDPVTLTIALAHAGWRSTRAFIVKNLISKIKDAFSINPKDLIVGFGPSIKSCCYEVKKEVADNFSHPAVLKKDGRFYLDLIKANEVQLLDCGILPLNIYNCGGCTACNRDRFYSYRADGADCGRNISIMMLK